MTLDEHCSGIGRIFGNLETLEFLLRLFLTAANGQTWLVPQKNETEVPETFITNYLSFGPIIEAYNSSLTSDESAYRVDKKFVDLRDALAHGRQLTQTDVPMTLYKFGKAKDGMVPIELMQVLTLQWFNDNIQEIREAIKSVKTCGDLRQFSYFTGKFA